MRPINRIPKIPEDEISPLVAQLLEVINLQMEEIQLLRDEIARLKNQKPRPTIKPSRLEGNDRSNKPKKKAQKKRTKKSKTKNMEIHETIPIPPDHK